MKKKVMNCKVTLLNDSVTFEARDMLDLTRQINAEDTFAIQDIVKIEFSGKTEVEYEDCIEETLSGLLVLAYKLKKQAKTENQTENAIDCDESVHSLIANLGYDSVFSNR